MTLNSAARDKIKDKGKKGYQGLKTDFKSRKKSKIFVVRIGKEAKP